MSTISISLDEIYDLAKKTLLFNGCDEENASILSDTMMRAERDGSLSHGLFRLPAYVAALKSKKVNGKARPEVKKISPSVIKVLGNSAFAPMVLKVGLPELIKLAKETGVAVLAITNSHHMAAMWPETEAIAEAGLVGFACTSYKPMVAPAGAKKALFGTNPISFAWPRPGKTPVVYDMATAAMAMGEVMVAARDGHKVPLGTGLNKDGKETTNPSEIADGGKAHPLVADAARKVASSLIRNSATLGGNICLDTRCFWFNQGEDWRSSIDWCLKCDCGTGADCRVIPNQNELCVATYQADLAPVLMCLGATIHLATPTGTRSMPLTEFFELDGITRNVLEPGELVTHLTLPEDNSEWQGDYQKLRQRESWDFPEAGVAVLWKSGSNGVPSGLRVATTGLEAIPGYHPEEAGAALEGWSGEDSVDELAEAIRKAVRPVLNTWYPPSYRRKMVKVLTKRASSGLLEV